MLEYIHAPDRAARARPVRLPLGQREERRILTEHMYVRPTTRRETFARDVEEPTKTDWSATVFHSTYAQRHARAHTDVFEWTNTGVGSWVGCDQDRG